MRTFLLLLLSFSAIAQPMRTQDPVDAAIQAYYQVTNTHKPAEIAAAREKARAEFDRSPAVAPQLAAWSGQIAQMYQNGGMGAQARGVLEHTLARMAANDPARATVLSNLAGFWEQGGNQIKAAQLLEQAAVIQAAPAPKQQSNPAAGQMVIVMGRMYHVGDPSQTYLHLANLYAQMGRPDAVAAIGDKIRALSKSNPGLLANFYQQRGQMEEAAAIYQQMADEASNPSSKASNLGALAGVRASQSRYNDAVAAMQAAIAVAEPAQSATNPGWTLWMRQTLAGYMKDAGQLDQADAIYGQLLAQSAATPQASQMLTAYAQYLGQTNRAAQGQTLLQDYLAGHPNLDPNEQRNILFNLANGARAAGDSKAAEEFQKTAQAIEPPFPTPPPADFVVGKKIQEANQALNQNRIADAFGLAMDALSLAPDAADGEQIAWSVPQLAGSLAYRKESGKADELLARMSTLVQSWKPYSLQPAVGAAQAYARYLENQPERAAEVPAAIEQYRQILIEANGAESGSVLPALRMRMDFESRQSQWSQADATAREILETQESLSGPTSANYLSDIESAAAMYQLAGDFSRAVTLYRKALAIGELLPKAPYAWNPQQTRFKLANALACSGQMEEAKAMAQEAAPNFRTVPSQLSCQQAGGHPQVIFY